jgi:hypothetical protein
MLAVSTAVVMATVIGRMARIDRNGKARIDRNGNRNGNGNGNGVVCLRVDNGVVVVVVS